MEDKSEGYNWKRCANCGKLVYRLNYENYAWQSKGRFYCGYNCRQRDCRRRGEI